MLALQRGARFIVLLPVFSRQTVPIQAGELKLIAARFKRPAV
jgi:hypothetical protein